MTMKKHDTMLILSLAIIIVLMMGSLGWALAPTVIEGYVKDAKTGNPLPGANVFIAGTSIGAASDLNGRYRILRVPPGSYTLRVTYIGYKPMEVSIQVTVGEAIKKDFMLEYVTVKGKEVVVTAQAEGQMQAINQQLSARQIMNVVASDRIQELPDANAAESVGRLPGVSVLREGGEGTKVVIRGLSPKYNAVMIEGVRMAPTDFNNRSSDLSMISPYMLEGIEVMKAITPDQDADILGGSVNFKIKEAQSGTGTGGKRFAYDFIGRGGYNRLKGTYDDYKFVGNVSTRLFNNRFGILAQADIERRNRSSQEMGAGYYLKGPEVGKENPVLIGSLNLRDITRERQRFGGTLVLDYRLPAGKVNLKNFFSYGDTKVQNRSEAYRVDSNVHNYSTTDSRNKLTVMTNVLNFEQQFPLFKVDAKLSHTYSENNAPTNLTFNFEEVSALTDVNPKAHPTQLPSYAKNEFERAYLRDISEYDRLSKDRELAAATNFEMNFQLSRQISSKIKFGGKYRYKDRSYDYNWAGGVLFLGSGVGTRKAILDAFPWMYTIIPDANSNLYYPAFIDSSYDPGTFLNGDYVLGPTANIGLMHDILSIVRQVNELESYHRNDYRSLTNDYSGNEYLSAGYLMADLNIGSRINIIPGVRYEHMKTSYTGVRGNSSYTGSDIFYHHHDTTMVQTNDFWLPMVHVRVKPTSWFDIRFAYTNTLSRPDFRQIIPRYNISTTSVSWHNYRLKPSHSENFDLYFSIHENRIGLFTVGGFVKRIDDLIFATGRRIILDPAAYDLDEGEKDKFITSDINNKYRVDVKGLEVDWQTHFWYLPGVLSGLVLNTNYTHIFSEAKYPQTIIKTEYIFVSPWVIKTQIDTFYTARLLHQPDDIVNVALGYDYKDFSIRLSMLYQSNIFKGANFWQELRQITDDYLRWDLSVKQDLPWYGLQLYCNVNNLTGALDRDLNYGSHFPSAEQHYGMTVDLGLRWRL